MSSEIRVALLLSDFSCEPAQLTEIVGIRPTRVWKIGDVNPKSGVAYRSSGWMLDAPSGSGDDLDTRTRWLLDRAAAEIHQLERVTKSWSVKLYCSVYTSGDRPPLFLSAPTVQRLASVGAAIDVDLFVTVHDGE